MSSTEEHAQWTTDTGELPQPAPSGWARAAMWCARALAQLWVLSLLLFAAAFAGIAAYQSIDKRAELVELRKAPGQQPYAVVAYRRELARQIHVYSHERSNLDAVPSPPSRPRLMAEIDRVRQRSLELRRIVQQPPPPPTAAP